MGVLDDIVARTRSDLMQRRASVTYGELEAQAAQADPVRQVLPRFREGFGAICEVKRASPSKGRLAEIADPAQLATRYATGGAAAISVLTEPHRFGGSLDDLVAVRATVECPVLRKDFIVDPYQVVEARAAGADLILLIVAALPGPELKTLHELALSWGMAVLVEVHTATEAHRAVDLGAPLIGINNRNLQTLNVDLAQFEQLVGLVPQSVVRVAESGISTTADVSRLAAAGADAILVGEALVRHGAPDEQVAAFTRAGRAVQTARPLM